MDHFPNLRCIVYFATASTFPIEGAKIEHRGARIHNLLEACRKPEEMLKPVNGRTIVFTTYPTLSKRWMRKKEEPFMFKNDSDTSSKKKRATTDDEPKGLKRYFASSLNLDDIEKLPRGQRGNADAVLVSYRAKKAGERIHKHHMDMIICDKAQIMRRVTGSYANMVQLFRWKRLLFVTGTPIASSLRDPLSPVTLIAYANKAIHDLKGLSSDVAGYVPGLYDGKYDAYQLDNEIIDESGQTLDTTKGILCGEF